jgi:molecular chaperone GrpE
MVADQLRAVLGKFGLQPFDAAGQVFDPSQHEAVSVLPSAETPANTVMAQARRGYRLGDRLLRPAQVVVSGGSPGAQSATATADGPATAPAQGK